MVNGPRNGDATIHPERVGEMHEWCEVFFCTDEDLRAAVDAVGTSVEDVASYLLGDSVLPPLDR